MVFLQACDKQIEMLKSLSILNEILSSKLSAKSLGKTRKELTVLIIYIIANIVGAFSHEHVKVKT